MLALGLTPKANEQGYEPEWLTSRAWPSSTRTSSPSSSTPGSESRSFGIAYNAESEPLGRSYPTPPTSRCGPDDEPAFGVEEIYYQMYLLAIGLQMAGPNLTPQTFEAGMFAYPGGSGPRGLWGFGPSDYTPTGRLPEIWWDPDRDLRPEQQGRGVGASSPAVDAVQRRPTSPRDRPLLQGGLSGDDSRDEELARLRVRAPTTSTWLGGYGPLRGGRRARSC